MDGKLHVKNQIPNDNTQIMDEVYQFLEGIRIRQTKFNKTNKKPTPVEIEASHNDRKNTKLIGINDNIHEEFEQKEKARKGLLYILNKVSNNTFCPEINDYFNNKNEKNLRESGSYFNKKESKKNIFESKHFDVNDNSKSANRPNAKILNSNYNSNPLVNPSLITFKKRQLRKDKNKTEKNKLKLMKNYVEDRLDQELNLFFSDNEIENTKNKSVHVKIKNNIKNKADNSKRKKSNVKFDLNNVNKVTKSYNKNNDTLKRGSTVSQNNENVKNFQNSFNSVNRKVFLNKQICKNSSDDGSS